MVGIFFDFLAPGSWLQDFRFAGMDVHYLRLQKNPELRWGCVDGEAFFGKMQGGIQMGADVIAEAPVTLVAAISSAKGFYPLHGETRFASITDGLGPEGIGEVYGSHQGHSTRKL